MSTTDALIQAAQARRTIYKLGKNSPVPDSKIEELVNAAILNVPSSFNTQSTRLVVLLREEHDKLWDITIETFKSLVATGAVPEEVFQNQTLPKLQGFKAAYGTVCFPAISISIILSLALTGLDLLHLRDLYTNHYPHPYIGPLLRRPRPHQALPGEVRHVQEPLRALG